MTPILWIRANFLRFDPRKLVLSLSKVRPVRSKLPARVGDERRKSFDFRNCISMQVKDTAGMHKRYRNNSRLPDERETAPSLGVRLVNAGRKREEKLGLLNRTTEPVGQAAMDKATEGALRCRHAEPANPSQGKSRMTGWPKKGTVSRSIGHIADGRSLTTRPGIKHRPKVAQNGYAEQSNPFDALQQWSRQPTASPNGRDGPRSQCLRESRRIGRRGPGIREDQGTR